MTWEPLPWHRIFHDTVYIVYPITMSAVDSRPSVLAWLIPSSVALPEVSLIAMPLSAALPLVPSPYGIVGPVSAVRGSSCTVAPGERGQGIRGSIADKLAARGQHTHD